MNVEIDFATMTDLAQKAEILLMMRALYAEDAAASPVDQSRFADTIEFLVSHPSRGCIVVFKEAGGPCGYAVLVPYWSNEFGGTLLFIDEMFVVPKSRNRGIGKRFFKYLNSVRPFDAVALALEVSPDNHNARRFYESLGFRARSNSTLTLRVDDHPLYSAKKSQ